MIRVMMGSMSLVILAAMYGCQVWSTGVLNYASSSKTTIHKHITRFLRGVLGVKRGTATMPLLCETGCFPIFFYWFRCILKFWNGLVTSNSSVLATVVRADRTLGLSHLGSHTWFRQVKDALCKFGLQDAVTRMSALEQVQDQTLSNQILEHIQDEMDAEGAGDPRHEDVVARHLATYQHYFASRLSTKCQHYLTCNLRGSAIQDMARFRLSSHHLQVEVGAWNHEHNRNQRICEKCDVGVEDEPHMVFECSHRDIRDLREQYAHLFANIDPGDLRGFCEQDCWRIAPFISACMNVCDQWYFDRHVV